MIRDFILLLENEIIIQLFWEVENKVAR